MDRGRRRAYRHRPGARHVSPPRRRQHPCRRRSRHGHLHRIRPARSHRGPDPSRLSRRGRRSARTEKDIIVTDTPRVVISGAGPNGLMLACELALAGITPVVLDALPAPSAEPKANGLVGQVVRMLDMRGLYASFTGDDRPQALPGWMFSGLQLAY